MKDDKKGIEGAYKEENEERRKGRRKLEKRRKKVGKGLREGGCQGKKGRR
jgi:hypothetical protein